MAPPHQETLADVWNMCHDANFTRFEQQAQNTALREQLQAAQARALMLEGAFAQANSMLIGQDEKHCEASREAAMYKERCKGLERQLAKKEKELASRIEDLEEDIRGLKEQVDAGVCGGDVLKNKLERSEKYHLWAYEDGMVAGIEVARLRKCLVNKRCNARGCSAEASSSSETTVEGLASSNPFAVLDNEVDSP